MSEINVISRTQQIIIDPASRVVAVVNNPGKSSVPTTGLPVVSGLSHKGTASMTVPAAGTGANVLLDPTIAGQMQKVGSDVEIIDAGANSYQMRVKQTGLYHVTGNIRVVGVAPSAGSLMGIRVNGQAVIRQTFEATAYASAIASGAIYLTRDDIVSMFAYSTGGTMDLAPVTQSTIDPVSPFLAIWRVSTVQLVS